MRIIGNTTEFHIDEASAVAIGKFDGFHRGHQKLLEQLEVYKSRGLKSVVFTFVPSPAAFFSGNPIQELSTAAEKRRIFEHAGVDCLIEHPFFKEVADMEPEAFIKDVLIDKINAKCIVAGEDVSFGRCGAGDCNLLKEKALLYNYEVVIIDKVMYKEREGSATYVREEVKNGNMELVSDLLGVPYHISGKIIHGKRLGRTLGVPTVNLLPPEEKLLPPNGVYYSYVYVHSRIGNKSYDGVQFPAITNIGTKPTVDNRMRVGAETYIYNFDDDVYGESLEVYLLRYKRPEMKFNSVDELKAQMEDDIRTGKEYHRIYS